MWPSSIASLIHIVASHEELWGKDWLILSVLKLESHFGDLGEGNGVARSTVTLISVLTGEVNTIYVSPVKVGWELTIWDRVGIWVFLLVFLGFRPSFSKVISCLKNLFLTVKIFFTLDLGKLQSLLLAVRSVTCMMLLELAGICFPSKIHIIDGRDKKIILI